MRGESIITVRGLSAGYGGRSVLTNVNMDIAERDAVVLIGPNGCGKSTFLRALTAEVHETAGTITFHGEAIHHLPTEAVMRRGIGYLRQTRNVFPSLSVRENLALAGLAYRRSPTEIIERFETLHKVLDRRAGTLSVGERQVVAIAMVLIRPITLLLLDEPVAGLSEAAATAVLNALHELQRDTGFALLLVEHRLRLVQPFVGRVAVMVRGEIVEQTNDVSILTDRPRLERHYRL